MVGTLKVLEALHAAGGPLAKAYALKVEQRFTPDLISWKKSGDGEDSWWFLVEKFVRPSNIGGSLWRLVSIVRRDICFASTLNIGDAYLLYQSYKRRYLIKPQTLYLGYQSSMC